MSKKPIKVIDFIKYLTKINIFTEIKKIYIFLLDPNIYRNRG
jgi:hypothetical protein